jgi:hypothetical protein
MLWAKKTAVNLADGLSTIIVSRDNADTQMSRQLPPLIPKWQDESITSSSVGEWWLAADGKQEGPFDTWQIREWLSSGQIIPERIYAWKKGFPEWVLLSEIESFKKR